MTDKELMEKIQTDIEALAAEPLKDFQVHILDQFGKVRDERVILNLVSSPEVGRAISGGVGAFEEPKQVEMRAEFPLIEDGTTTNRDKAFAVLEQLKTYIRATRALAAGGDTSRYATFRDAEIPIGFDTENEGEATERVMRIVSLIGIWTVTGG